jgi:PAS domain S-box-containing protein
MSDARRAAAEAIAAAARAAGSVLWLVDREARLAGPSPSLCDFTGLAPAQAAERGWLEAVEPADRERVERAVAEGAGPVECRLRRPNGRFTRARLSLGALGEGVAIAAAEVWADESVRRSEERLRLATEAARVAVWEYDFVAGQMTRTENHDGLYGLPHQVVWQYDIFVNATHPEDRPVSDRIVMEACAPGGPDSYAFDFRVIWPDGSVHWLAVSGQVVARDGDGRATLVRGALIDVTRLKNVEAELVEAVAVRDQFLDVASHELKTPLTPLALRLEHMARLFDGGARDAATLRPHLEVAQRALARLTALVSDLLDATLLSRGALELRREPTSLPATAREVLAAHAFEAGRRGCAIELHAPDELVGDWDRRRIAQVIDNLLDNAVKYSPRRPIDVTIERRDGRARLAVRNAGAEIDPEFLPRMFDKFARGGNARNYGGLGLGLFMVRQIVESHGGEVTAAADPEGAVTVAVELPLST